MDHIIIEKVINNNIISAYEKSGAEVIVMGRGIGFKKKQGEVVIYFVLQVCRVVISPDLVRWLVFSL